jgi:hypothetical protein
MTALNKWADLLGRSSADHRLGAQLLALRPFMFPARTPEQPLKVSPPRSEPHEGRLPRSSTPPPYPCPACAATTPFYYCISCRTECQERQEAESPPTHTAINESNLVPLTGVAR